MSCSVKVGAQCEYSVNGRVQCEVSGKVHNMTCSVSWKGHIVTCCVMEGTQCDVLCQRRDTV